VLCGDREDVNHIIFSWPLSEFVWALMSEVLGWMVPLDQWKNSWVSGFLGNLGLISNRD
jgi:hypothetical protein